MFGLFKKSGNEQNKPSPAEQEMQQTMERFFVFLEKLEAKMKEFSETAIPELIEIKATDSDEYKRGYHRMKAAVLGQFESIRKKADEVREEKIGCFDYENDETGFSKAYYNFREACYSRHEQFEKKYNTYTQQVEQTDQEDFELKYQKIIEEYETVKNKFKCVQCSSPISIDKLYFTTVYITCPACQTQNTFDPGSKAKQLEHIGRALAEQRTAHLLKAYECIPEKVSTLYHQQHQLSLNLIHEKDTTVIAEKKKQIAALKSEMQELENSQAQLYQVYLRAMFDEWNNINPTLKNEHERFYQSLLEGRENTYSQNRKNNSYE